MYFNQKLRDNLLWRRFDVHSVIFVQPPHFVSLGKTKPTVDEMTLVGYESSLTMI